jgi:hypothetical protein
MPLTLAEHAGLMLGSQVFLGLLSLHDHPYSDVEVLIEDMTNAGNVFYV